MLPNDKHEIQLDGRSLIGKKWTDLGLSNTSLELLQASKSAATWAQYKSSLDSWIQFCKIKHWCPEEKDLCHYVEFLSSLYERGLSYSTINTARSAFSAVFGKICGVPIGENKIIVDLMKGISRLRPVKPRYSITWNPDKVLIYLQSIQTNSCNLKELTFKTVAILALATGQRVQTLASIRLSNIHISESAQIVINDRMKTTTVTRSNPVIYLPPFQNFEICPVKVLIRYINCTKDVRNNNDELFLSFAKPHKAVGSETISRWLVNVLDLAGISSENYKAHSFRHASTSKAAKVGVHIDSILKRVGWSKNSSVFARFYNRPIINDAEFAESILNIN